MSSPCLQVQQLLEMLKADVDNDSAYSGEGSNTDSGRGPSEEGDKSLQAASEYLKSASFGYRARAVPCPQCFVLLASLKTLIKFFRCVNLSSQLRCYIQLPSATGLKGNTRPQLSARNDKTTSENYSF